MKKKLKELFTFEGIEFIRKQCRCGKVFESPVAAHRKRCRDCKTGVDVIEAMNKTKK